MKKICLLLMLFGVLLGCSAQNRSINYPAGKDTVCAYGDGSFQVLTSPAGLVLYSCRYQSRIIANIAEYRQIEDQVYFYGQEHMRKCITLDQYEDITLTVYAIVDVQSNFLRYYSIAEGKEREYLPQSWSKMVTGGDATFYSSPLGFSSKERGVLEELSKNSIPDKSWATVGQITPSVQVDYCAKGCIVSGVYKDGISYRLLFSSERMVLEASGIKPLSDINPTTWIGLSENDLHAENGVAHGTINGYPCYLNDASYAFCYHLDEEHRVTQIDKIDLFAGAVVEVYS